MPADENINMNSASVTRTLASAFQFGAGWLRLNQAIKENLPGAGFFNKF